MIKMRNVLCLFVLGLVLSSCATIYEPEDSKNFKTRSIYINSSPPGASVYLNNEPVGYTPMDLPLQGRGVCGGINISVRKDNFESQTTSIETEFAKVYLLNIITLFPAFGLGFLMDPILGNVCYIKNPSTYQHYYDFTLAPTNYAGELEVKEFKAAWDKASIEVEKELERSKRLGLTDRTNPLYEMAYSSSSARKVLIEQRMAEINKKAEEDKGLYTVYDRIRDDIKYDPIDFQEIVYASDHPDIKNSLDVSYKAQVQLYNSQLENYQQQMVLYNQNLNKYNINARKLKLFEGNDINKSGFDDCIDSRREEIQSDMYNAGNDMEFYAQTIRIPRLLSECINQYIPEKKRKVAMGIYEIDFSLYKPKKPNPPIKPE